MSFQHSITAAPTWHLAQLKPNGASLATRNLVRQGYEVFNPKHLISQRRGELFVSREVQLFPGYLFVGLGPSMRQWGPINGTLGVSRLVGFGGVASVVPGGLINELRRRCDTQGKVLAADDLAPGDAIRILSGPFAEFVSSVERIDAQQRVWVLLDILGRASRVQLDREAVTKL
ncbi:MAG: transcription termination/antitermination protein NusG [Rhodobacterales bacterium]